MSDVQNLNLLNNPPTAPSMPEQTGDAQRADAPFVWLLKGLQIDVKPPGELLWRGRLSGDVGTDASSSRDGSRRADGVDRRDEERSTECLADTIRSRRERTETPGADTRSGSDRTGGTDASDPSRAGRPESRADRAAEALDEEAAQDPDADRDEDAEDTTTEAQHASILLAQLQPFLSSVSKATGGTGQSQGGAGAPMGQQGDAGGTGPFAQGSGQASGKASGSGPPSGQANGNSAGKGGASDTGSGGNSPVGGSVTRMWTGPAKTDLGASGPQSAKGVQQNQALAAEATRQIARFALGPRGQGPALASAESSPQTVSSTSSSGVALSQSGAPSGQTAGVGKAAAFVPPAETSPQENIDRIVRVLRAHVGDRESQVRIQLDPPELGRVRIDIRMRGDVLFLNVETDTAAGRELLSSRLTELREALQQQGIVVERANVEMREAVQEAPQAREQQQQQSSQSDQNPNQEAPGQPAHPSQDSDYRDEPAQGDDVPAPSSQAEADGSADADDAVDVAAGGDVDPGGGGNSGAAAESWVDLVA